MEKPKPVNTVASAQLVGESSTFICTECGDGFSQYTNLLTHMASHGPLESFTFDGSSNGFEIPREYVLQENGTLTVVNGFVRSQSPVKPASPGILPSHYHSIPSRPVSPTPRPQPTPFRDVFRPKPSDLNIDKSRQGHFRCEICGRSFNNLQSLHRHQQYRNTERGYKCTLCCKIFEGRQDLKKHLQSHISERFHCCSHCGKRFLKVDALKTHLKEKHPPPIAKSLDRPESKQGKKMEKNYSCKKCKLNFFWISDFQTHALYHCKGKVPIATFPSEIENEVHAKNGEVMPLENCYNGKSVNIKNGDSTIFKDSSGKLEHSFTPYRCGLCGDRFQKLTALKEHHRTHQTQEEIDQQSQESQKTFKRKIPPKARRRRSSNPNGKLHPCKHCHRVFNHSSSLSRHMRYHKGTMHTCALCGRHFPQRCDLRRHIAMYHKTELEKKPGLKNLLTDPQNGPEQNSVIGEKITNSPDEKTKSSSDNEQTASQEQHPVGKQAGRGRRKNYKCQECGKKFGLLCVYQRHLRYHKKEPNKCPRCPAQFMNSSSLELHLQNHPNVEEAEDVGQTSHATGSSRNSTKEKGNQEDAEDDYVNNIQKDQANSSDALYECTECTETFSCLETFLQHQSSHSSEKNGKKSQMDKLQ
ncbi:zinc finger protein 729-like [Xyrichtys novacula]|uniref:Zinc finger protein 729-like n=1 Tax=Xyrichtys novacula TaxID=13765 RepID=A0AAV1FKH8_XYRNO|nr:zinc finger protein 729-like [Xyrichtys novacula]